MSIKPAATESEQAELVELRRRYIPRGITTAHPMVADHAKGAELWDVAGRRYIDFAGGIGVMNVGQGHPHVMEAVKAQLDRVTHTSFQVVMYESYLRLAERLSALAPGEGEKKAIFFSTGAEAVENAVKIARAYTGRPAVISFQGSFHGRTLLALSLTGSVVPYKQNFGPYATEIFQVPFPYEYHGWSTEMALAALDDLFESAVAPERVAAIIIEPVLGEGGFVPAPKAFLEQLRALTKRHGILLIVDEIQSGFGRTGKFFAIEHSGISPDLVTVAKSLAAGFPLSGVVGRADVMDAPGPGGLGGTYGGNPVACAAGLAVLDVMRDERRRRARPRGDRARAGRRHQGHGSDGRHGARPRPQDQDARRHRDRPGAGAGARTGFDPPARRRSPQRDPHPHAADHPRRSAGRGARHHRLGSRGSLRRSDVEIEEVIAPARRDK